MEDITMSKKFTEEQYQNIVDIWNNEYSFEMGIKEVLNYIQKERLANAVYESTALANPLTREWAHDKYVEKEKKYYWTKNNKNKKLRLYKNEITGMIAIYVIGIEIEGGEEEKLTESEIREWGYNPEVFDKEEVD